MILIFSDPREVSTNHVIDWLIYYKVDFIRVCSDSQFEIDFFDINTGYFELLIDNKRISSTDITGYWYRRNSFSVKASIDEDDPLKSYLSKIYKRDISTIILQVINLIENSVKNSLGSYFNHSINKLHQLEVAKKCGLKIPESYISRDLEKIDQSKKYITKPLNTIFDFIDDNYFITNYTNEINREYYSSSFAPTLVQEKINKKFEIRTFYIENKTFSMAIFSQQNPKTEVDFRKYDDVKPNRRVPFNLPKSIDKKIIKLMNQLHLNTGSLDIIYTQNGDYLFLEVNPIGQFGMTSIPCNYYIEKNIADFLVRNGK